MSDSYQQLSTKIIDFLQPMGSPASTSDVVETVFQAAYIRDFLENYTHFHTHFPILHIPTFRITDAYVGLLAGMCCIGACYSDSIPAANIREVMDCFDDALRASSRVFVAIFHGGEFDYQSFGCRKSDIEDLQAVMLIQVLLTWHGTPSQREKARSMFPPIASFVHKVGLLRVSNNSTSYSAIHQPDFSILTFNPAAFDWTSWVEQEKRIRITYFIYLSDVALGLYFNRSPEFDSLGVHLPLPADDAAWEANNSTECLEALGLCDPELARIRNPDGTQRCNQPQMRLVLKTLLDDSYEVHSSATNLYRKFILIHAILAMMKQAQLNGSAFLIRQSPLPHNPLFIGAGRDESPSDTGLANGGSKLETTVLDPQWVQRFTIALKKFKRNWDQDMALQFPPSATTHPRRYGFSKDGIHFYWLARYFLGRPFPSNIYVPPDTRFRETMHVLKAVKGWVLSDGASRGEELGSVGEIDAAYADGNSDLTLDITQLFRPLSELARAPGIAAG